MKLGSERTNPNKISPHSRCSSSLTFQIDRHLTEEIIGFETIVVPQSKFKFLVLQFFSMGVTIDDRSVPNRIQSLRNMFDAPFIFLTRKVDDFDQGSAVTKSNV